MIKRKEFLKKFAKLIRQSLKDKLPEEDFEEEMLWLACATIEKRMKHIKSSLPGPG